jgi:hypothetical protein
MYQVLRTKYQEFRTKVEIKKRQKSAKGIQNGTNQLNLGLLAEDRAFPRCAFSAGIPF